MTASANLLEVHNLSKSFRGLQALEDYSLALARGELLGVIGPNGAGKTTLFNLMTGIVAPTTGTVRFDGADITAQRPDKIARAGMARTFQKIRLFRPLTALENLRIALQSHESVQVWDVVLGLPRFRRNEASVRAAAHDLLERLEIGDVAHKPATQLSYGQQRRLEFACALALQPRLLLLDEPAAGMNPTESDALMHLVLRLHDELGLTIVLIEHNMRIIMNMCRRIQVLNYGRIIAEGAPDDIREDPLVVEAYLGQADAHVED